MNKNHLSFLVIGVIILLFAVFLYHLLAKEKNSSITEVRDDISTANTVKSKPIMTNRESIILKTPDFFDIKPIESFGNSTTTHAKNLVDSNTASPENHPENNIVSLISNIEKLLSIGHPSEELDQALVEFLENSDISRSDKIYPLWNLIIRTGLDTENGNYLLEYIEALQPIELTEDIIVHFNSGVSEQTQGLLIDILYASTGIANPELQTEEQLTFIATRFELVQNFLEEQIYTSENHDIFKKAFMLYPSIVPTDQAVALITDIFNNKSHKKLNLSEDEMISLSAQVAFSTNEAQIELLPELLESFSSGTNSVESQSLFNDMLYSALLDSSGDPSDSFLADEIKPEISSYIKVQEPSLSSEFPVTFEDLSKYYAWAQAYVNVSNPEPTRRNQAMAVTALEASDPAKASAIILLSEPEIISYIQQSDSYSKLKESMESYLSGNVVSEESKQIINDALEQIK